VTPPQPQFRLSESAIQQQVPVPPYAARIRQPPGNMRSPHPGLCFDYRADSEYRCDHFHKQLPLIAAPPRFAAGAFPCKDPQVSLPHVLVPARLESARRPSAAPLQTPPAVRKLRIAPPCFLHRACDGSATADSWSLQSCSCYGTLNRLASACNPRSPKSPAYKLSLPASVGLVLAR